MWRPVPLLLLLACATTSATSNPKVEPAPPPPAEEPRVEAAWEREDELSPSAPRPTAAPPVDRFAGFRNALAQGQAALKGRRFDEARAAAEVAVREAAALDGEARFQAHQLLFRVEQQAGTTDAQAAQTDAWFAACGPEKVEACRAAALAAMLPVAKKKDADKALLRHAKELQDAEQCSLRAERGGAPNACEATAVAYGRREKDLLVVQRVQFANAMRETNDARRAAMLDKAETVCSAPACTALRRKLLGKLVAYARSKNDVDGAVKYALREAQAMGTAVPDDQKVWARPPSLDQTCGPYDAAHGAGSCRTLERKTLGYWTFRDWSKDAAGEGLSAEQVRTVNEHFSPLLQQCLSEQARRMRAPDAQRFELRWVVLNDGRVAEAHLRKDLDESPLAQCLRAQFGGWRYPRYDGEFQNVEQAFTVTAVERRAR